MPPENLNLGEGEVSPEQAKELAESIRAKLRELAQKVEGGEDINDELKAFLEEALTKLESK